MKNGFHYLEMYQYIANMTDKKAKEKEIQCTYSGIFHEASELMHVSFLRPVAKREENCEKYLNMYNLYSAGVWWV